MDLKIRGAAFVEAADCFAALVSCEDARRSLLRALCLLWGLPEEHMGQYEARDKPTLSVGTIELQVGRVLLPRFTTRDLQVRQDHTLGPCMCLCVGVCVCVCMSMCIACEGYSDLHCM